MIERGGKSLLWGRSLCRRQTEHITLEVFGHEGDIDDVGTGAGAEVDGDNHEGDDGDGDDESDEALLFLYVIRWCGPIQPTEVTLPNQIAFRGNWNLGEGRREMK